MWDSPVCTAFCCEKVSNAFVRMGWDMVITELGWSMDVCDRVDVYGLVFGGSMPGFAMEVKEGMASKS